MAESREYTELKEKLSYKKTNFYEKSSEAEICAAYDYAVGYTEFLDRAKTEREAVKAVIKMAQDHGYKPYSIGMKLDAGGKYYYNNRKRNLILFRIGSEPLERGMRIAASHIDAPRIDVKQVPLYEDSGMAFLKTRYYGGIRKYQWVATPLSLHGVVALKDGSVVDVVIGEDENDPILYINDLLPHLAAEQANKPLRTAIPAENLNLLIGSRPYANGDSEGTIKLNVLRLLNEKYGICEEDLLSADLSATPAAKARDVGLDRSLIGAYGHDDRVCAYPSLTALFESDDSVHSSMVILADKEETGSDGTTGMKSEIFIDLLAEISASMGAKLSIVKANSLCLSADVTACYDPNFPDVSDPRNSARINCGVSLSKYTGHGGKSDTSEASAEYVAWIRRIFAEDGVIWQTADIGKTDLGGGGTVAKYIANHNIATVDIGVPVISMHAPCEVISKADLYTAHKAFCAFLRK